MTELKNAIERLHAVPAPGEVPTAGRSRLRARVDHRFALSMPALVSAPSKKSFPSANCPIFARSAFTSTGGSSLCRGPSNTSAARSSSCFFHSVTWCGCTSNCSAISASVLSPRIAASARARFELPSVIPSRSSCDRRLRPCGRFRRPSGPRLHLPDCLDSWGHLCLCARPRAVGVTSISIEVERPKHERNLLSVVS